MTNCGVNHRVFTVRARKMRRKFKLLLVLHVEYKAPSAPTLDSSLKISLKINLIMQDFMKYLMGTKELTESLFLQVLKFYVHACCVGISGHGSEYRAGERPKLSVVQPVSFERFIELIRCQVDVRQMRWPLQPLALSHNWFWADDQNLYQKLRACFLIF